MSKQKTPNSLKQWIQSNRGEYQGNIVETRNCDTDSFPGTLKTSKKLTRVDVSDEYINGEVVMSLTLYDRKYIAVTTDRVRTCGSLDDPTDGSNWGIISSFNGEGLGLDSDATVFDGKLLVSIERDILAYDGSLDDEWWTDTVNGTALSTDIGAPVHTLEVLRSGNDTLFVTDQNLVRYYNAEAGHTTITLDTSMYARCLVPGQDRMWVGTSTEVEEHAFVYELRVGDTAALRAYPIGGRAALSMFVYKNTPFVITDRGTVEMFNGVSFEPVAFFPWAHQSKAMDGILPGLVQTSVRSTAMFPKGSKVINDYVYMNINTTDPFGSNEQTLNEQAYAGVWVLDLKTYSISHRYSLGDDSRLSSAGPLFITKTPQTRVITSAESVDSSLEGAIFTESEETNKAHVVFYRHEAESIADAFEKAVAKSDTMDASSYIELKYRNKRLPNLPLVLNTVNWLNTTQFTTTDDTSDVAIGYEVFVQSGVGAGEYAHVTKIEGGNTKTITLDAAIGAGSGEANVSIDNWLKYKKRMTAENGEYKDFGGNKGTYTFVQYKAVLSGDITLREFMSKSNSKHEQ